MSNAPLTTPEFERAVLTWKAATEEYIKARAAYWKAEIDYQKACYELGKLYPRDVEGLALEVKENATEQE